MVKKGSVKNPHLTAIMNGDLADPIGQSAADVGGDDGDDHAVHLSTLQFGDFASRSLSIS